MAPEIIELESLKQDHFYAGGPIDVYSCGVSLYTMIVEDFPFGKAGTDDT